METKELLSSPQPHSQVPRRRFALSRKLCILLTVLITLITIAVAVGLGVGLTKRNSTTSDAGSSTTSTTSSSTSTTTMGVVPSKNGLWQPSVNASWQIVLANPLQLDLTANSVSPNVDVWDIDMFTNSNETISHLHALGKRVVCYFSAGSYEPGRPDSAAFQSSDLGGELDGWPGEHWLNISSPSIRNIMAKRIDVAYAKGCDAIDPDNVDGYSNSENGLGLTQQDSIEFIEFLSETAAKYNISTGLKNAGALISTVIDKVHFAVNEQCVQYSECSTYTPFITANKPVFHIEYPKGDSVNTETAVTSSEANTVCVASGKASGSSEFSTTIKNINLDGWVEYCNGELAVTPCASSGGIHSY